MAQVDLAQAILMAMASSIVMFPTISIADCHGVHSSWLFSALFCTRLLLPSMPPKIIYAPSAMIVLLRKKLIIMDMIMDVMDLLMVTHLGMTVVVEPESRLMLDGVLWVKRSPFKHHGHVTRMSCIFREEVWELERVSVLMLNDVEIINTPFFFFFRKKKKGEFFFLIFLKIRKQTFFSPQPSSPN